MQGSGSFRYTLCARNDVAQPEALRSFRVHCPKQTLEPEGIYIPVCLQEMPHPMLCCPHATHTCISSHTLDDLHGGNSNRIRELHANRIQATNDHHRLREGQGHALFQGTTLALAHQKPPCLQSASCCQIAALLLTASKTNLQNCL